MKLFFSYSLAIKKLKVLVGTKVILFVKNSLEVDGRGLSPYSQVPTHYPTQRSRGNPITLNLFLYSNIIIYIPFDLKRLFNLKGSTELNVLIALQVLASNYLLIKNNFYYNLFNI
jgi:hypothetical protein